MCIHSLSLFYPESYHPSERSWTNKFILMLCLVWVFYSCVCRCHHLSSFEYSLREWRVDAFWICVSVYCDYRFYKHFVCIFSFSILFFSFPSLFPLSWHSYNRVALYGLLMFYDLTKDELKGKRPLAKFLCIKLIVMFTFYQSFVVRTISLHCYVPLDVFPAFFGSWTDFFLPLWF